MWKTILISFILFIVAFIFGRLETKLNRLNELERRMKNGKKN